MEGEEDGGERIEEEQEREDQEMMEGHQRNHIGMQVELIIIYSSSIEKYDWKRINLCQFVLYVERIKLLY